VLDEAETVSRILVLQLKRIGDLILTAPALAELRAALPQSEIVLLTAENTAELARCIPAVNRVVAYRRGRVNLDAWTSAVAGPWSACLDFTGTDRSALLTGLSHAGRRIGFEKFASKPLRRLAYTELCPASVRELHTLDFHRALVEELTGPVSPPAQLAPPMALSSEVLQRAQKKLVGAGVTGDYAVIHPGSAREEKFWLPARWAGVIQWLVAKSGLQVVLTGSDDALERRHLDAIRRRLAVPVADLTGCLSLPELAAVMEHGALMCGVDSMAMHLAAMFCRPQVALFGPTNPFHWGPRHSRAAVLLGDAATPRWEFHPRERKQDMKNVSTQAVLGAIESALREDARACAP
jgi:ADP-heptose:LPS heptosyltransferase